MKISSLAIMLLIALAGCTQGDSLPVDRSLSPESAFYAARSALHRKDLPGYFDALTDAAVRRDLANSIGICINWPKLKDVMESLGHHQPIGCDQVLARYGWHEPAGEGNIQEEWDRALKSIARPRAMAAELESLVRETGAGSSFVWSYLDPVEIEQVSMRDATTADAAVLWSKEKHHIAFIRDKTGWRFDPHPDVK